MMLVDKDGVEVTDQGTIGCIIGSAIVLDQANWNISKKTFIENQTFQGFGTSEYSKFFPKSTAIPLTKKDPNTRIKDCLIWKKIPLENENPARNTEGHRCRCSLSKEAGINKGLIPRGMEQNLLFITTRTHPCCTNGLRLSKMESVRQRGRIIKRMPMIRTRQTLFFLYPRHSFLDRLVDKLSFCAQRNAWTRRRSLSPREMESAPKLQNRYISSWRSCYPISTTEIEEMPGCGTAMIRQGLRFPTKP